MALVGAVGLAACGDDSSGSEVSARTAAPAGVVGSDVHLTNQAAEIETRARVSNGSDVHLTNQAAEIESRGTSGSDVHLANQAAENAEREAHLAGGAATAAQAALNSTSNDDFVPGTRRMPAR